MAALAQDPTLEGIYCIFCFLPTDLQGEGLLEDQALVTKPRKLLLLGEGLSFSNSCILILKPRTLLPRTANSPDREAGRVGPQKAPLPTPTSVGTRQCDVSDSYI